LWVWLVMKQYFAQITDQCTHLLFTPLYQHFVTWTCFSPQRAIFRDYDWYISRARSTKWVTRRKIQFSEHRVSVKLFTSPWGNRRLEGAGVSFNVNIV